ncbi:MAG TPA: hypothetical protein VJ983_04920 [candidate division Zixibacteria bacterium]|nr:hypothetical protein [candidate division Zixibacteria bacterium]
MKRRLLLFIVPVLLLLGSIIVGQSTVKNPHGNFNEDCQDCHTTSSWTVMRDTVKFDHAKTGFALVGAHASAQCIGCHKSPIFSRVGTACIDCHDDQHHGQLGTNCENCHSPRDWKNRQNNLDLHASRGFALTGAHAVADCEACHEGYSRQEYAGTPVNCYGCHADAYNQTTEPNHREAGFPTECESCHRAASGTWRGVDFIHPASFPLTGGHQGVACQDCHTSGYTNTNPDCYSCHSADFTSTNDPPHESGGFPHDCKLCHTIVAWQPAQFDHSTTSFPLTGAHVQVSCASCHSGGYTGTPTDCYSCHQTEFVNTTDPNHAQSGFSHTCTQCHTTTAWNPANFDHSSTGFALTGAHANTSCLSCHSSGYAGTPTDCYSCHQSDYQGTSDPNHVAQGFPTTCQDCHSTTNWSSATFDHSTTGFALTGAHASTTCISCHSSGYAGTPTDCYSCHQSDYQGTTDPNHVAQGFPTTCQDCHSTTNWSSATFDHSTTGFALTGAHATATCVSCHSSGYTGTPTACYACHSSDYQGTTDPNHQAAGFPTDCQSCHSTSGWSPANWDHDSQYFPIYSGTHSGRWNTCADCHVDQSSFAVFECINCHEHNKTDTDRHHTDVRNYQYLSTACYNCHPRGRAD